MMIKKTEKDKKHRKGLTFQEHNFYVYFVSAVYETTDPGSVDSALPLVVEEQVF